MGKNTTSAPNVTEAPKEVSVTNRKRSTKTGKSSAEEPKLSKLVSAQLNQSTIEITDLLDNITLEPCVELTHRLFACFRTLPPEAARSQGVLKAVVLFVAELWHHGL